MWDAVREQLPVLLVVIPLVAAPVTVLLPPGRAPWLWAVLVSWLTFAVSVALIMQVDAHGTIEYHLGAWPPPIGIEYRIDLANALVLTLVSGIAAIVFPYARASVASEINIERTPLFYGALLICLTGLLGVTATADAFNVFVFLEISSLSTYALVAMGADKDRRALTSAFNYLVMGTIGATFFVIGVGLLYMATGTLNMADLHVLIHETGGDRMVRAGFAFIVVGFGLKLAMFPMHHWLPNAYTFAPSAVTAFLAASSTKVAVYVIIRFLFTVFGVDLEFERLTLKAIFVPLGVAGMVFASLVAIFQADVKRMLAYSSVAQIGYMLLGISTMGVVGASGAGVAAALLHVFNHALMKGALFMALGCVMFRLGSTKCEAFAGLGRRMPWTTAALVVGGLSLIGVPLTVGFVSKLYLLGAVLQVGWLWAALIIVASSLLAVVYMGRVLEPALLRPAPTEGPFSAEVKEAPASMLIPLWVLTIANIVFGVWAVETGGVAERAAMALIGGGN